MVTYIALLRGINVSGKNIIKMASLKQLFINLGYKNIQTYIQSGNVIFSSEETKVEILQQKIKTAIEKTYEYSINILVLTKSKLDNVFNSNPFIQKNKEVDISKLYITFLSNTPNLAEIDYLNNLGFKSNDEFTIKNKSVYIYCPNGYGKTKLTNHIFEKKLKCLATSRNWKTTSKLVELSNN